MYGVATPRQSRPRADAIVARCRVSPARHGATTSPPWGGDLGVRVALGDCSLDASTHAGRQRTGGELRASILHDVEFTEDSPAAGTDISLRHSEAVRGATLIHRRHLGLQKIKTDLLLKDRRGSSDLTRPGQQRLAEGEPRSMKPGLDRVLRNPHDSGRVLHAQFQHFLQHNRHAKVLRQHGDRLLHTSNRFPSLRTVSVIPRRDSGDSGFAPRSQLRNRLGRFSLPLHAATTRANGNCVEPRAGIGLASESVPLAIRLQEDVLHEVFRISLVATQSQREAVQFGSMLTKKRRNGFPCVCSGHVRA